MAARGPEARPAIRGSARRSSAGSARCRSTPRPCTGSPVRRPPPRPCTRSAARPPTRPAGAPPPPPGAGGPPPPATFVRPLGGLRIAAALVQPPLVAFLARAHLLDVPGEPAQGPAQVAGLGLCAYSLVL